MLYLHLEHSYSKHWSEEPPNNDTLKHPRAIKLFAASAESSVAKGTGCSVSPADEYVSILCVEINFPCVVGSQIFELWFGRMAYWFTNWVAVLHVGMKS